MQSSLPALRARYNPEVGLITGHVYNVGYHTALPGLSVAHPYRENAIHALSFLRSESAEDQAFGQALVKRVLEGQETDSLSPWYGIWSWFAEEPLPEMKPADWNWADFVGTTLIIILQEVPHRLTPELRAATEEALGHAAWSVFRRNVTLDYTNIAMMGAAVTLAAGRALNEPRLVAYGRSRLGGLRAHFAKRGVAEYNSPNYTLLAVNEIERILALPLDADARADAEAIHHLFWSFMAPHFHPATGQWSGPHSRNYTNFLKTTMRMALEERLGFSLAALAEDGAAASSAASSPTEGGAQVLGMDDPAISDPPAVPCPAELRERFRQLPSCPHDYTHTWTRNAAGEPETVSTTWFDDRTTLGSVSHEIAWYQCQPILAYWLGDASGLGRLRVRVLMNGKDFVSAQLRAVQKGPQVLCSVEFLAKEGTYHPHFDKPADGVFHINDLRLRVEVEGADAKLLVQVETHFPLYPIGHHPN